jgi:hypothetical protein
LISCAWVLPSRLILFDLTFSLLPGPLFLLASVGFKVSESFYEGATHIHESSLYDLITT